MCGTELAILVVSCDGYADLWEQFFALFDKYWPDCPYAVYLGSNHRQFPSGRIKTICVGEDRSWADNVRSMLEQIPEPYVLMLLEDFFINKTINTRRIGEMLSHAAGSGLDCLRLNPCPPPCNVTDRRLGIGDIERGSPYYISTQPAIWKRSPLIGLMRPGFSAWDFEIKNSRDSGRLGLKINGSDRYVVSHKNGVERGLFYKSTLRFLKHENIAVDEARLGRGTVDDVRLASRLKLMRYRVKEYFYVKLRLYRRKEKRDKKICFLITSCICPVERPLSYSDIRTVFSDRERMEQTKRSIRSVRAKCPDADIVLVDNGVRDPGNDLAGYVDRFYYVGNKALYRAGGASGNKSIGEAMMSLYAVRKARLEKYGMIFKLSGRYFLTDRFSLSGYDRSAFNFLNYRGGKAAVSHGGYVPGSHSTRLYSVPGTEAGRYRRALMVSIFLGLLGRPIEHSLPRGLKKGRFRYHDVLGVSGEVAVDASVIDE